MNRKKSMKAKATGKRAARDLAPREAHDVKAGADFTGINALRNLSNMQAGAANKN